MSLMFIARMTRPDTLLTVTYLASKSSNPTKLEWNRCIRVVQYLKTTRDYGLHINCQDLQLHAHCDASYGSHIDGMSHTGFSVSLGSTFSFLMAKSTKQRIGALSSTEAEVIAATECAKTITWMTNLISELNIISMDPAILYQDNMSTITVITKTDASFRKVKHLLTRLNYIRFMYQEGRLEVLHIRTEDLHADALTKPLARGLHYKHIKTFGVIKIPKRIIHNNQHS